MCTKRKKVDMEIDLQRTSEELIVRNVEVGGLEARMRELR